MTITVEKMKEDYDWGCAWEYGGKPSPNKRYDNAKVEYNAAGSKPMLCEGAECSTALCGAVDVSEVIHAREGEDDGPEWLAVVRLEDGRYAFLMAGCDYTG